MEGILLCGHGTRSELGKQQFADLVCRFGSLEPEHTLTYAFMELQRPTFAEAVEFLRHSGIDTVRVLPVFLFEGIHLKHDIPGEFKKLSTAFPELSITMARGLGSKRHLEALLDEVVGTWKQRTPDNDPGSTHLVVVGVGSSNSKANIPMEQITQTARLSFGFQTAQCAFLSSTNHQSVENVLEHGVGYPSRRWLVVPMLLFEGYYFRQIRKAADYFRLSAGFQIEITVPLGTRPIAEILLQQRLEELRSGAFNLLEI